MDNKYMYTKFYRSSDHVANIQLTAVFFCRILEKYSAFKAVGSKIVIHSSNDQWSQRIRVKLLDLTYIPHCIDSTDYINFLIIIK